jgi:hypothetical protein
MQDSAKRDLVGGIRVGKSLGTTARSRECVSQENDSLRCASNGRYHDPQCFVQIEVPLVDWLSTRLVFFASIVL